MLVIRKNTRTEPSRPTHVLHWVPGPARDGRGLWALQGADDYDAGLDHDGCPELLEPVAAPAMILTAWAATQIGAPVVLEDGGEVTITAVRLRPPSWHRSRGCPVWYVWPARQP